MHAHPPNINTKNPKRCAVHEALPSPSKLKASYNATKAATTPTINAALAHCRRLPGALPSNAKGALVETVRLALPFVHAVVVEICDEGTEMSVGAASWTK